MIHTHRHRHCHNFNFSIGFINQSLYYNNAASFVFFYCTAIRNSLRERALSARCSLLSALSRAITTCMPALPVVVVVVAAAATVDFGVSLRVKVIGKNFCFCFCCCLDRALSRSVGFCALSGLTSSAGSTIHR